MANLAGMTRGSLKVETGNDGAKNGTENSRIPGQAEKESGGGMRSLSLVLLVDETNRSGLPYCLEPFSGVQAAGIRNSPRDAAYLADSVLPVWFSVYPGLAAFVDVVWDIQGMP